MGVDNRPFAIEYHQSQPWIWTQKWPHGIGALPAEKISVVSLWSVVFTYFIMNTMYQLYENLIVCSVSCLLDMRPHES